MLGFVLFAMVLAASAIIGGAFYWGFRNGTLSESEEERFDRRFDEIIATDVYVARLRRSES